MSLHRSKAAKIGHLEADRVNEWVVTEKLGSTLKNKTHSKPQKKPRSRIGERYDAVCHGSPQGTSLVACGCCVLCFHCESVTAMGQSGMYSESGLTRDKFSPQF